MFSASWLTPVRLASTMRPSAIVQAQLSFQDLHRELELLMLNQALHGEQVSGGSTH